MLTVSYVIYVFTYSLDVFRCVLLIGGFRCLWCFGCLWCLCAWCVTYLYYIYFLYLACRKAWFICGYLRFLGGFLGGFWVCLLGVVTCGFCVGVLMVVLGGGVWCGLLCIFDCNSACVDYLLIVVWMYAERCLSALYGLYRCI